MRRRRTKGEKVDIVVVGAGAGGGQNPKRIRIGWRHDRNTKRFSELPQNGGDSFRARLAETDALLRSIEEEDGIGADSAEKR